MASCKKQKNKLLLVTYCFLDGTMRFHKCYSFDVGILRDVGALFDYECEIECEYDFSNLVCDLVR